MTWSDAAAPALPLTGERTVPGIWHENYWFRRHEAAYEALRVAARGAVVLEAGCGEGYGAAALAAGGAARVVAVDYDPATVAHVALAYPQLLAVRANLVALPIATSTVDLVVSLQVLEHLWDQPAFVDECARVLRPGGRLALTTPNRLTFSPGLGRGEKPVNPFHVNELDAEELQGMLAAEPLLADVRVQALRHGPRLAAWEAAHGSLMAAQLATPPEEWSASLAGLVRSVGADDFELTDERVDEGLDLVAWATRR